VSGEPTTITGLSVASTRSAARGDFPPPKLAEDQALPTKLDEDDFLSAKPSKKGKKVKKDKKRGSIAQESVEHAAAETSVVEAHTREPPTVETLADSTIGQNDLVQTLPKIQNDMAARGLSAEREISASDELQQYPFPEVSTPPHTIDEDKAESVRDERTASSRRKGGVSKKGEERLEAGNMNEEAISCE
jgi:hypothetical protein